MERVLKTGTDLVPYILIAAHGAEKFADEVWEQLAILLGTRPGEQALDRDMGIEIPIDALLPHACAATEAAVVMQVRKYIAGVHVTKTAWLPGGYDGKMTLKVVVGHG